LDIFSIAKFFNIYFLSIGITNSKFKNTINKILYVGIEHFTSTVHNKLRIEFVTVLFVTWLRSTKKRSIISTLEIGITHKKINDTNKVTTKGLKIILVIVFCKLNIMTTYFVNFFILIYKRTGYIATVIPYLISHLLYKNHTINVV
ncbi:hypothetical protein, partial [Bacillus cereus]|uniref:hypothetical protein n=1 Tax=Bacillus cereus TaxID=1396 RepID=UPI001C3F306A